MLGFTEMSNKPVTVTPMARSDLRSGKSRLCQFQLSLSLSLSLSRPCQFQLSFSLSLSRPCQFQLSFSFSLSLSRPCQFQLSISILGQGSRLLTYICKMKVILWTLEAVCLFWKLSFYPWGVASGEKNNFFFR